MADDPNGGLVTNTPAGAARGARDGFSAQHDSAEAGLVTNNSDGARRVGHGPLEKDFSRSNHGTNGYTSQYSDPYHLDDTSLDNETALKRIRTAGSISISPELFEKIYLSPQNAVKGDLRKTFGNPTPVAIVGFLICLTPLSCDLMGWRGAGGNGAASTGAYFFFGGVLMLLGGFLEFVLGNTFPFVVFSSFGAFWLTFGATLQPFYNAYGFYAPMGEPASAGLNSAQFAASFGFFLVFMGLLCLVYLICSLRTNLVFVIIFLTLVVAFGLLAGTYWQLAQGAAVLGGRLQIAAGAVLFVTCMAGWYLLFAILLLSVDFPLNLPVGDLSGYVKGAETLKKEKNERDMV